MRYRCIHRDDEIQIDCQRGCIIKVMKTGRPAAGVVIALPVLLGAVAARCKEQRAARRRIERRRTGIAGVVGPARVVSAERMRTRPGSAVTMAP